MVLSPGRTAALGLPGIDRRPPRSAHHPEGNLESPDYRRKACLSNSDPPIASTWRNISPSRIRASASRSLMRREPDPPWQAVGGHPRDGRRRHPRRRRLGLGAADATRARVKSGGVDRHLGNARLTAIVGPRSPAAHHSPNNPARNHPEMSQEATARSESHNTSERSKRTAAFDGSRPSYRTLTTA